MCPGGEGFGSVLRDSTNFFEEFFDGCSADRMMVC